MRKDVIIIGGGAAGLMCAAAAGKRGRSVLLLEHSEKIGKKIRVSGGGRCNFTNLSVHSDHYLSRNPDFCKSALARFGPGDFISLIGKHGIGYEEKEEGQLFCESGSGAIIRMLERECRESGVEIRLKCRVAGIRKEERFLLSTSYGTAESESLVIATGGLSYPALGASGLGYRVAEQFGLRVISPQPGLVALTLRTAETRIFRELSGVSLRAAVRCGEKTFEGGLLFTHRGLSGPVILQASSYWRERVPLSVDLLPHHDAHEIFEARKESRAELRTVLAHWLPQRLCRAWCEQYAPSRPMAQFAAKELKAIADRLHHWDIVPAGTEGYHSAEVTVGGVDTEELSSKTMEARNVAGLYFVGEVVDVTGQLGGYNLQWAWSSGFAAGQYA